MIERLNRIFQLVVCQTCSTLQCERWNWPQKWINMGYKSCLY